MGEPNEHGVYRPTESLTLPNPKQGWRGLPLAEIDLLELPDGWRSAIGAQLSTHGRGEPITLRSPVYVTRDQAIEAGIAKLRRWLASVDDSLAATVTRWLDVVLMEKSLGVGSSTAPE